MKPTDTLEDLKILFLDTEFTGEHQFTSLVSLALVTLSGKTLYLTLNDYDESQVSDWLQYNVIENLDSQVSIDSRQAALKVTEFINAYSEGKRVYIVSAGLMQDVILLFELFKFSKEDTTQFHSLHDLPLCLRHHCNIDLNTLFRIAGISPSIKRENFAQVDGSSRHNALSDAQVVRACFIKLCENPSLKPMIESLVYDAKL